MLGDHVQRADRQHADHHAERSEGRHVQPARHAVEALRLVEVEEVEVDPREDAEPAVPLIGHLNTVHDGDGEHVLVEDDGHLQLGDERHALQHPHRHLRVRLQPRPWVVDALLRRLCAAHARQWFAQSSHQRLDLDLRRAHHDHRERKQQHTHHDAKANRDGCRQLRAHAALAIFEEVAIGANLTHWAMEAIGTVTLAMHAHLLATSARAAPIVRLGTLMELR
mmetsp:Transcript_14820/g.44272  ORF Transcript_14820/g.44272 Transcript_14820/m.44272 type:complete len:223 (-) Transcript_14820:760-1428(-)